MPACLPCTAHDGGTRSYLNSAPDCWRLQTVTVLQIVSITAYCGTWPSQEKLHPNEYIPLMSPDHRTTALRWRGDQPRYKILLLLLASVGSVAWWRTAGPLATGMERRTLRPHRCHHTRTPHLWRHGGDLSSIIQTQGSYNWCLEYHSYLLTPWIEARSVGDVTTQTSLISARSTNSKSHCWDVMNTQITRAAINSADGDLAHNAIDTQYTHQRREGCFCVFTLMLRIKWEMVEIFLARKYTK